MSININLPQITTTSLPHRRSRELASKLTHLSLPLAPLVRLTTGEIHPSFPRLLVNFWLLTSDQLDDLASFYHQRTPCEWTRWYPCPVVWDIAAPVEVKRRRLGRFIGLRGCESPLAGEGSTGEEMSVEERTEREREREVEREIERDIERRRAANEESEMFERKGMWY